jgi:hypothetical protein
MSKSQILILVRLIWHSALTLHFAGERARCLRLSAGHCFVLPKYVYEINVFERLGYFGDEIISLVH